MFNPEVKPLAAISAGVIRYSVRWYLLLLLGARQLPDVPPFSGKAQTVVSVLGACDDGKTRTGLPLPVDSVILTPEPTGINCAKLLTNSHKAKQKRNTFFIHIVFG